MPRGRRLDAPGLLHHIIVRGIEQRNIFIDNNDYDHFVARLAQNTGGKNNRIYAFALMPNHAHLLVRSLAMPLSTLMRRLLTGYAIYFNRRYKRCGHLFQNRYKSIVVDEDRYMRELLRYIHLNPLRGKVLSSLATLQIWPYTGHAALIGSYNLPWYAADEILTLFGSRTTVAREALVRFMYSGIKEQHKADLDGGGLRRSTDPAHLANPAAQPTAYDERILGSGDFVSQVLANLEHTTSKQTAHVSLEELISTAASIFSLSTNDLCSGSKRKEVVRARAVVIWYGVRRLGIATAILANALNVTAAAVRSTLRLRRGELDSQMLPFR
ncbi:MAG: transposase [Actinobacteria bacterium]|nr:transposase [Actinomycetota bacterium]